MKNLPAFIFSLAILLAANPSFAQTLYWDGGTVNITTNGDGMSEGASGTWDNTTENWDQGSGQPHTAWISGADAVFGPGGTVTLGAAITANSLTVPDAYIFTDGGNAANTLTVNSVTNSSATTISNNIVNSTGFTMAGSSTLTLTAASADLTAPLTVDSGTLILGNNTLSGPTSFASVTVASNATFEVNPGASTIYGQTISGAGALSVHANSSSSTITLDSEANTFTGNVTINQATLSVFSINDSSGSDLGMGTNLIIGVGGSASVFTYTGGGDTTTRTITLGGSTANTIINADNIYGPLTLLGPLAFSSASKHTLTLSGTSSYINVFGGTIPDNTATNTAVVKSAAGTWMLTGSNSYSGGTTISGGSLLITNDYDLGAAKGALTFTGNAALKSTNDNVMLGAARTVTISSNIYTATFAVTDTNNLDVASYITGPGSVQKGSASYLLGTVRFSNDTNNFAGAFTAGFGATEFTSVTNSGSPCSLGLGTTNSGAIILANSTSSGILRYVGAGNSATLRPLIWTATTGGYALDNTNTGTIAYLNTTSNLVYGAGSKGLTLEGSNTGTNTLAQVVNDDGGSTSLTKSGTGQWVLTGANTFSGTTTISGGTLSIDKDGNLGTAPGSATPNSLTINGGTLSASASFTLNANRGIALGPTGTNSLGAPAAGDGTIDVAAGQTLSYGGVLADSTPTNTGGLVKTSAGTLTLTAGSTYTGDTSISAGTLALSGSGSIADSTNIYIDAGATLDVSGVGGGYSLAPGQVLQAVNGATATINGSLNLGLASLVISNIVATPTIAVSDGSLTLAGGEAVTVNLDNGGSPLGAGSYLLITTTAGGSVAGTAPASVMVGGDGIASGATASLSISNNELYLVVSGGTLYPPVVNHFGLVGGQAVLSFSGTSGQTWKILTSTNLTLPLANWSIVTTGVFAGATVNYTNGSPVDPQRFYLITSP